MAGSCLVQPPGLCHTATWLGYARNAPETASGQHAAASGQQRSCSCLWAAGSDQQAAVQAAAARTGLAAHCRYGSTNSSAPGTPFSTLAGIKTHFRPVKGAAPAGSPAGATPEGRGRNSGDSPTAGNQASLQPATSLRLGALSGMQVNGGARCGCSSARRRRARQGVVEAWFAQCDAGVADRRGRAFWGLGLRFVGALWGLCLGFGTAWDPLTNRGASIPPCSCRTLALASLARSARALSTAWTAWRWAQAAAGAKRQACPPPIRLCCFYCVHGTRRCTGGAPLWMLAFTLLALHAAGWGAPRGLTLSGRRSWVAPCAPLQAEIRRGRQRSGMSGLFKSPFGECCLAWCARIPVSLWLTADGRPGARRAAQGDSCMGVGCVTCDCGLRPTAPHSKTPAAKLPHLWCQMLAGAHLSVLPCVRASPMPCSQPPHPAWRPGGCVHQAAGAPRL
jgi:hypothetical protein